MLAKTDQGIMPVEATEEALIAIDRAEDNEIIARLTSASSQQYYAYSYGIMTKDGPVDVVGISVDGSREIARMLGNIKVSSEIKVEDRGDYFYAVVPVTDLTRNVTLVGVARQSKYIIGEGLKQDERRIDEWAFVKAINKAQRNGILAIAPQNVIQEIISKLDPKLIKRLKPLPQDTKQNKVIIQPDQNSAQPSDTSSTQDKVTDEDKRELKNYLKSLGIPDYEIGPFVAKVTGKSKGWTKQDFEKVKDEAAQQFKM